MNYRLRIWLLFGAHLIFALVLISQLYIIQVVNGEEFKNRAINQYVRPNYHLTERGDILMRLPTGELMPLATTQTGYLAAINPKLINRPGALWQEIEALTDLDRETFLIRASRDTTYAEIQQQIRGPELEKWRQLDSEAVGLYSQNWRHYPGDRTAAHVAGFVGFQGDQRLGQYGLERQYEAVLSQASENSRVNFFAEIFTNLTSTSANQAPKGDLITTLDPVIQTQLENRLRELKAETNGRAGGAIIMDPQTGAVRAMSAWPDFDPNLYNQADHSSFINPNIENVYEMGSVIKALTIASGLDAGVITPDSEYYDPGRIEVDNFTITNFDGRGHGYIDMQTVLNQSVNTGVVHIMDKMGSGQFAEYMKNFGLAEKTGIDLPNEAENMLRSFESPRRVEYATASFGQGIALTPIGTIRALAALGNGGQVIQPHIVETIKYSDGQKDNLAKDTEPYSVISPETSQEITRMLVHTVDEALLNGQVKNERYSIAAKTGTAQIPHTDRAGYRDDAFLHSFFGYFPAFDPEFIILLYVIEPHGFQYASQSLTYPFIDLTDFLINHYEIPPDR